MKKSSLKPKYTRFRAYQLGQKGSSFSYFDGSKFTLIEARITEKSRKSLFNEMKLCGVNIINCLHITSWDADHCALSELDEILDSLAPIRIEYPGYEPNSDNAKECLCRIKDHKRKDESRTVQKIDPPYVKSLKDAERWGYRDIIYHPKDISENDNDNSTVQLFRSGCFNVASLGDVESNAISAYLKTCSIFCGEVDVMILAHHGADNGFTTSRFLRETKPTVAICSSNYDSQFDHPKPEIRDLLKKYQIPIYTTKTGDALVLSMQPHTKKFKVVNLIGDSKEISSIKTYDTKKSKKLNHNLDTVRNIYEKKNVPFRKIIK